MHAETKSDILDALIKSRVYLELKDYAKLSELSNHTIHDVSIFQSQSAMKIAIILYSISKLIERGLSSTLKISSLMHDCEDYLQNDRMNEFRECLDKLIRLINQLDTEFPKHISDVLTQARLKKSSKLFEHGLSIAKSAEILGISRWDLLPYVGNMTLAEHQSSVPLKERIENTRRLFK